MKSFLTLSKSSGLPIPKSLKKQMKSAYKHMKMSTQGSLSLLKGPQLSNVYEEAGDVFGNGMLRPSETTYGEDIFEEGDNSTQKASHLSDEESMRMGAEVYPALPPESTVERVAAAPRPPTEDSEDRFLLGELHKAADLSTEEPLHTKRGRFIRVESIGGSSGAMDSWGDLSASASTTKHSLLRKKSFAWPFRSYITNCLSTPFASFTAPKNTGASSGVLRGAVRNSDLAVTSSLVTRLSRLWALLGPSPYSALAFCALLLAQLAKVANIFIGLAYFLQWVASSGDISYLASLSRDAAFSGDFAPDDSAQISWRDALVSFLEVVRVEGIIGSVLRLFESARRFEGQSFLLSLASYPSVLAASLPLPIRNLAVATIVQVFLSQFAIPLLESAMERIRIRSQLQAIRKGKKVAASSGHDIATNFLRDNVDENTFLLDITKAVSAVMSSLVGAYFTLSMYRDPSLDTASTSLFGVLLSSLNLFSRFTSIRSQNVNNYDKASNSAKR